MLRLLAAALLGTAALALVLLLAAPASAQPLMHDARASVGFPSVLGRGGAGVAVPTRETAFFVNPAHAAATPTKRLHLSLAGVSLRAPVRTREAVTLVREGDADEQTLIDMTRSAADVRLAALGPSVSFGIRDAGVVLGVFGNGTARVQTLGDDTAAPVVGLAQVDGIGVGAFALRVPGAALTVGLAGKYVRRYLSTVVTTLDDTEDLSDFEPVTGTTVAFDAGALWASPIDGLTAGLAVYNLLGGGFDYSADDPYGLFEAGNPSLAAELAAHGGSGRSLALGAAYRLGGAAATSGVTVALDLVTAATTADGQSIPNKLRLGAEGRLGGFLTGRVGFSQGYPSLGATLFLGLLEIDYALFGQTTGFEAFTPSGSGGYQHALLVRIGLD